MRAHCTRPRPTCPEPPRADGRPNAQRVPSRVLPAEGSERGKPIGAVCDATRGRAGVCRFAGPEPAGQRTQRALEATRRRENADARGPGRAHRAKERDCFNSPTLRRAWPRDGPEAAICVQGVDVQCVLQFTLIHAASCALHRRASRVIHRSKLFSSQIVCRVCAHGFTRKKHSAKRKGEMRPPRAPGGGRGRGLRGRSRSERLFKPRGGGAHAVAPPGEGGAAE